MFDDLRIEHSMSLHSRPHDSKLPIQNNQTFGAHSKEPISELNEQIPEIENDDVKENENLKMGMNI